jgi:hypothetical protein
VGRTARPDILENRVSHVSGGSVTRILDFPARSPGAIPTTISLLLFFNLLKPSGNFTYDQV